MFSKVKVNANKYFEYFSWISVLDPKKDWFVSIPKTYLSAQRRKQSALIKIFSAPNNKNAGKNSKHLINYSYENTYISVEKFNCLEGYYAPSLFIYADPKKTLYINLSLYI